MVHIFKPPGADTLPQVGIAAFQIFELQFKGSDEPTKHLVGFNVNLMSEYVSSPIVKIDTENHTITTRSGRKFHYDPRGTAEHNEDLETFVFWRDHNGVTEFKDVTKETLSL